MRELSYNPLCLYSKGFVMKPTLVGKAKNLYIFWRSDESWACRDRIMKEPNSRRKACAVAMNLIQVGQDELYSCREGQ